MSHTVVHRLFEQEKMRSEAPAYMVRTRGVWVATSWATYAEEVRRAARALIHLGLEPGGRVCILGFNRPEWTILDLATMTAGGAPAGIYTTCSAEEVGYILNHAEAPVVLLENAEQWAKIEAIRGDLPHLKRAVLMKGARIDDPLAMTWEAFLDLGADPAAPVGDGQGPGAAVGALLEERVGALQPDEVATLIYTSGTTGPPKAVMLSHENLAWTSRMLTQVSAIEAGDRSLSYLPLSHIAEQMASIHCPVTAGTTVYFAESIERVPDNLKEVRPHGFFGVPRIWEKFQAGIAARLDQATGVRARLAAWAQRVGARVHACRNRGEEPSGPLALQYGIAKRLVFQRLKVALGLDEAKVLISGAAPLGRDVIEFLAGLDLVVHEIYGQSEGSGPTSFNMPGHTLFGSVGTPLPGVEVKLGPDDEILVRGPNVFLGYFKDEEATRETLDEDGWLHSGDLGRFDDDGFLHITGRKKDIIITAGGKNVTPKNIEIGLKGNPLVHEAVVIGDRRKYLTAVISLDEEAAAAFLEERSEAGPAHASASIRASVQATVDEVNARFARVEQVKRFALLPRPLSIEGGELTPTLKVKRTKVSEHFADVIDALYAE